MFKLRSKIVGLSVLSTVTYATIRLRFDTLKSCVNSRR